MFSKRASSLRLSYIVLIAVLGHMFALQGLLELPASERLHIFFLLMALAILAQFAATGAGVTFEVSSAVSLAVVPFYGPAAAALVATAASLSIWIIKRLTASEWKGTWEQLLFNTGMGAVAIYAAGHAFMLTRGWLGGEPAVALVLPWLIAAIVGDQVNVWLLIGILRLQQGIRPLTFWRENGWAMPINVIVMGAGGGVLALAVAEFDTMGIAIFFLPVFLSAYAFRIYVARTRRHLEQLEELVAERTQELVAANESLANLNKQKDAFLAVLTHDMRSPLTNIHGYASLLRDHPELPEQQRAHMTQVILRNEMALQEIVNNILDIEHLESGMHVLVERRNFDLVELVNDLVVSSMPPAQEKQIALRHESAATPLFVHADRQKVSRIVQNLISNAIKYTPENGQIAVRAVQNGRFVKIEVEDTGYGIPAAELPHIFNRYSRVDKHRNMAVGTGLGLAIVKSLIEAHEGHIEVQSEEGAGSKFVVSLPA